jgi:hypothetical protein
MERVQFEKIDRNHFKVLLGTLEIGFLNVLRDFYSISILGHSFKIKRSQKRFIRKLIISAVEDYQYVLEAEKRNLPIRINKSTKLVPRGIKEEHKNFSI